MTDKTEHGALDRLAYIVEQIDVFADQCAEAEYTDTDDAWQLLRFIRESLAGPRIEVTEHKLPD